MEKNRKMSSEIIKTLVNFRIESIAIHAFDNACRLSGQTRTQVLNDVIRDFTVKAADLLPKQIAEERRSFKALKNAVERAYVQKRALALKDDQSPVRPRPMKSFAQFIANDPIVKKRR